MDHSHSIVRSGPNVKSVIFSPPTIAGDYFSETGPVRPSIRRFVRLSARPDFLRNFPFKLSEILHGVNFNMWENFRKVKK